MYESTGEMGESTIRRVDMATGKVLQKWDLPSEDFGEGSTVLNDKIYMITWRGQVGRVFDPTDLKLLREFSYVGEGWGITTDGTNLIMSQGTHVLKVLDPETFKQVKTIPVMREDGRPLMNINELEFVKGEIWANIWHSEQPDILGKPNHIARIDATTGKLVGWIDLAGISPDDQPKTNDGYDPKAENTLNGIAYDAENDRIFLGLFLGEAIALSELGGLLGLLLGMGLAQSIHLLVPALPVHAPFSFVVLAEGIAILIGLLAGVLPARRAARLDAVEALRAE